MTCRTRPTVRPRIPAAPTGPAFDQVEFERYAPAMPADAVIACTSLHHAADLELVLDHVFKARFLAGPW